MPRPPSLPELQRAFAGGLVEGDVPMLAPWIAARGIDPAARMQVYRNAGYAIHVEALEAVFPVVRAFVGEESFDGLATRYTARHGSTSGNLQHFGRDFAVFIRAQPEMAAYPWLRDVAQLEWLRQEALLAAGHPVPPVESLLAPLQGAGTASLYVRLQPHVRVLRAETPALDLWNWAQDPQKEAPDPTAAAQCVLLWREATRISMSELDTDTAAFVLAMKRECNLATMLGGESGASELAGSLQLLIENALITCIAAAPLPSAARGSRP